MGDKPLNGSNHEPLTDEQKTYASRFHDWLLTLSREDFKRAANILQQLKHAYYNREDGHVSGEA